MPAGRPYGLDHPLDGGTSGPSSTSNPPLVACLGGPPGPPDWSGPLGPPAWGGPLGPAGGGDDEPGAADDPGTGGGGIGENGLGGRGGCAIAGTGPELAEDGCWDGC